MAWAIRTYENQDDGSLEPFGLTSADIFQNRENAEYHLHQRSCEQVGNRFVFELEEIPDE